MNNLIYYKYQNKEISTPHCKGYLTNFTQTKDWIAWLQKEFEVSQEEFKEKQFDILFKNTTTQLEWRKLFYSEEEIKQMEWGISNHEQFKGLIGWPPIYLHPLMEDYLLSHCGDCGQKAKYDVRKMKEDLKGKSKEMSWCMVSCEGCGKIGRIDKDCIYRICKEHTDEQGRNWWKAAWKKLGVREL